MEKIFSLNKFKEKRKWNRELNFRAKIFKKLNNIEEFYIHRYLAKVDTLEEEYAYKGIVEVPYEAIKVCMQESMVGFQEECYNIAMEVLENELEKSDLVFKTHEEVEEYATNFADFQTALFPEKLKKEDLELKQRSVNDAFIAEKW